MENHSQLIFLESFQSSNSNFMVLNTQLIEKIKEKSGLSFDKAKDFDSLCAHIFDVTKRTMGITTIKRLLGYIDDDRNTNEYTMNTIALYLGYKTWNELCSSIRVDSEWRFEDNAIYIDKLIPQTEIEIKYLNRVISFIVIRYEQGNALQVVTSMNSSLRAGDILVIHSIKEGSFLEAEKVIRGESIGNYRTNGEIKHIKINGDFC